MLLDTIHSRQDLLDIPEDQLGTLCGEIRQFLVQNVSRTGGHLASNLGIVETTVAIHRVFDTSRDRLVFDGTVRYAPPAGGAFRLSEAL